MLALCDAASRSVMLRAAGPALTLCKGSDLCGTLPTVSKEACLRLQLGRRLIAETPPLPDVPDGPFLMKQEALPSMTGMIPVPLQDRVGVPASSDGDLRQSGSSSQGACVVQGN